MTEEELKTKRIESIVAFILAITGFEISTIPLFLVDAARYFFTDGSVTTKVIVTLGVGAILACPIVALYLRNQSQDINERPFTIFNRITKIFSIISLAIAGSGIVLCFIVGILTRGY